MINLANEMMPIAPAMTGCCFFGTVSMIVGLVSMATPLIAIAAVVYLLAKRPQANIRSQEV